MSVDFGGGWWGVWVVFLFCRLGIFVFSDLGYYNGGKCFLICDGWIWWGVVYVG